MFEIKNYFNNLERSLSSLKGILHDVNLAEFETQRLNDTHENAKLAIISVFQKVQDYPRRNYITQ